jgi:hypothetical protein
MILGYKLASTPKEIVRLPFFESFLNGRNERKISWVEMQ